MTLFTLCGNLLSVFNLMLNVQVAGVGVEGDELVNALLYGDRAANELGWRQEHLSWEVREVLFGNKEKASETWLPMYFVSANCNIL